MKEMTSVKREKVNGHYRVLLIKKFCEMRLSESTQLLISKKFVNVDKSKREGIAKYILDSIQNCETENDIIKVMIDLDIEEVLIKI